MAKKQRMRKQIKITVVGRYFDSGESFVEFGTGYTRKAARENALAKSDTPNELDVVAVFLGHHWSLE